jgi:hypothetical protein
MKISPVQMAGRALFARVSAQSAGVLVGAMKAPASAPAMWAGCRSISSPPSSKMHLRSSEEGENDSGPATNKVPLLATRGHVPPLELPPSRRELYEHSAPWLCAQRQVANDFSDRPTCSLVLTGGRQIVPRIAHGEDRWQAADIQADLKQDSRTLEEFMGIPATTKAPAEGDMSGLSPNAQAAAKTREEEMNRSVLGQLKPDYAKADGSFGKLRYHLSPQALSSLRPPASRLLSRGSLGERGEREQSSEERGCLSSAPHAPHLG